MVNTVSARKKVAKHIIVLIPTYNEASNIEQVITAVERFAVQSPPNNLNLLIIDDDSPDGTAQQVNILQNKYDNITLISDKKAGLGRAYIRGFRYALAHFNFDILIMMDADLSHDPKEIPELLNKLDQDFDYVIGSRYTNGSSHDNNWPFSRVLMSRCANLLARKLIGRAKDINDITSGFKAMNRTALEQIDIESISAKGYVFQVSLLYAFLQKDFKAAEVPIDFTNRSRGSSKLKLQDIIEFVYQAYKLNPNAPIQRIVRFGFVGACGSLVNLLVLSFLVRVMRMDTLLSAIIAIEVSIIFNFFLNHVYTFKGYGAYKPQQSRQSTSSLLSKLGRFNLGALGGAIISFSVFSLLYKLTAINYLLADTIAIITAMSWNYWMSTRFVWKAIDKY